MVSRSTVGLRRHQAEQAAVHAVRVVAGAVGQDDGSPQAIASCAAIGNTSPADGSTNTSASR